MRRYEPVGVALGWDQSSHRNGCAILQLGDAIDRIYYPRLGCNKDGLSGKVRRALRAIGATQCDPVESRAKSKMAELEKVFGGRPQPDPSHRAESAAPIRMAASEQSKVGEVMKNGAAVHADVSISKVLSGGTSSTAVAKIVDAVPSVVAKKEADSKPNRIQLSHDEVVKVTMLLGRNGDPAEGGVYVFDAGWSDERILEIVRPGGHVDKIAEIRRKHFGQTKEELHRASAAKALAGESGGKMSGIYARMAKLESDNASLRVEVATLREAIDRLDKIVAPLA